MKHCAIVATHHKTGTVWMRTVFQRIARCLNVKFIFAEELAGRKPGDLVVPSIIFDRHSRFHKCRWLLDHPDCRIFHLIRDPRDVIVSAMHYHRVATEGWLLEPKKRFAGLSYQEKINSLANDRDRYDFEMHNIARRTIEAMRKWNYDRTNTFECQYEQLIVDSDMTVFTRILHHLGFEEHEFDICREVMAAKSLFGSTVKTAHPHIRSGSAQQWEGVYDAELADLFLAQFKGALIELGYEPDNSWAKDLRNNVEAREVEALRNGGDKSCGL